MNAKSKSQIESEYADLLGSEAPADMWRLIRSLDAQYSPGDRLARLPGPPAHRDSSNERPSRRPNVRRLRMWRRTWPAARMGRPRSVVTLGAAVLAALVLSVGVVLAASGILNLGKPTTDLSGNPNFPLDGFHNIKTNLTAHHRPELLFISTQHDPLSAVFRWPLVKALDRFGVLAHVDTAVTTTAPIFSARDNPTFDLTHSTFRSRYLTFVHKDVLDSQGHYLQKLNSTELRLYVKYVRWNGPANECPPDPADPEKYSCSVDRGFETSRMLPLLVIGSYLQTDSQFVLPSLLEDQTGTNGLSFAAIQTALQTDKEPFSTSSLVSAVNGEANIITALICHVDGKKPASACGGPVIKSILKHVK